MSFTQAEVEAKIVQTSQQISHLQRKLDYWRQVLSVMSNPLFAELSVKSQDEIVPESHQKNDPVFIKSGIPLPPSQYGLLKRLTSELLPEDLAQAITPQELAKRIAETGYVFRTKTPSISVNDTLNTLQKEGKARLILRRAPNGAGLWVKAVALSNSDSASWFEDPADIEKEAPEGTP